MYIYIYGSPSEGRKKQKDRQKATGKNGAAIPRVRKKNRKVEQIIAYHDFAV